jgi:F-type H+-transporting ATPase subunit a
MDPTGHVLMTHVVLGCFVAVFIILLAIIARRKYSGDRETALVPEGKLSFRNFFEGIFDAVYTMMEGMMGEKQARRHFPIIATLAVFILLSNLLGLVPGFIPPTQNLNSNVGPALIVFLVYNISGLRENGWSYIKHFFGPVWYLGLLMVFIELASHAARPLSLSLRLAGNMTGDHTVLGVFGGLATDIMGAPLFLPIPFYFLGLLVCVIQTLVFCLLSSVYISLAVAHEEH